jgi:hypothetical protein
VRSSTSIFEAELVEEWERERRDSNPRPPA